MLRKVLNFFKTLWGSIWDYLYYEWEFIAIIALIVIVYSSFFIFLIYLAQKIIPLLNDLQDTIKPHPNHAYFFILAAFVFFNILLLVSSKTLTSRQFSLFFKYSEVSTADIIKWSMDIETSMEQIQKAYDWKINQWSSFGKALLTATLAFISAVIIAIMKGEITLNSKNDALNVVLGVSSTLIIYCISLYQTRQYRKEYLAIYTIMRTFA